MEVDEAVEFFPSMPNISHSLQLLKGVGLHMADVERLIRVPARGAA